jgi:hypothetical protein
MYLNENYEFLEKIDAKEKNIIRQRWLCADLPVETLLSIHIEDEQVQGRQVQVFPASKKQGSAWNDGLSARAVY